MMSSAQENENSRGNPKITRPTSAPESRVVVSSKSGGFGGSRSRSAPKLDVQNVARWNSFLVDHTTTVVRAIDRCANSSTRFTPLTSLGQTRDGLTRERKGSMPRTRGGARGSRLRAGEAPRGGRQSAARRVAALRGDLRRTRDAIGLGSARVRRERRVRRASGRGPVRARLRRGGHHAVVAHA